MSKYVITYSEIFDRFDLWKKEENGVYFSNYYDGYSKNELQNNACGIFVVETNSYDVAERYINGQYSSNMFGKLMSLKNEPRISNFWYNPAILITNRKDSIWYDNDETLISFILDKKYRISMFASGEKAGTISYVKDNVIEELDFKNHGTLDCLYDANIQSDDDFVNLDYCFDNPEKMLEEIQKGKPTAFASIHYSLNNWFEFEIINNENKDIITEAFGTDVVCDFDDMFDLISIADDYIDEYYNGDLSSKERKLMKIIGVRLNEPFKCNLGFNVLRKISLIDDKLCLMFLNENGQWKYSDFEILDLFKENIIIMEA